MLTVVSHRLVCIDLRIDEAYCYEMMIKRSPYDNRVALTYFDISLGNTKGHGPPVPAKMARESTGSG
jgi:hypothetical protein